MSRVQDVEEALRQAYRERDEAIGAAAAANPDASAGTLARELGLKVRTVRAVLRGFRVPQSGGGDPRSIQV